MKIEIEIFQKILPTWKGTKVIIPRMTGGAPVILGDDFLNAVMKEIKRAVKKADAK